MANPGATQEREGFPDRPSLRRALRDALRTLLPELRVVAEGFLAEVSNIDLLAVGRDGELVAIRFAEAGDDAAALTRALADLSWLRPRRADLLKLASGLGIEPSAEPRALLFCREFGPEVRAAFDNFPAHTVELWHVRGLHRYGQSSLVIERPGHPSASPSTPPERDYRGTSTAGRATTPSAPPQSTPEPARSPERPDPRERARTLTAPPSPSAFRTGLVDADLERPPHADTPRRAPPIDANLQPGPPPGR